MRAWVVQFEQQTWLAENVISHVWMNELVKLIGSRVFMGCTGIYRFLAGDLGHSRSASSRLRLLFLFEQLL